MIALRTASGSIERCFAVLIDKREASVKVSLKPGGVFQITYALGQKWASWGHINDPNFRMSAPQ